MSFGRTLGSFVLATFGSWACAVSPVEPQAIALFWPIQFEDGQVSEISSPDHIDRLKDRRIGSLYNRDSSFYDNHPVGRVQTCTDYNALSKSQRISPDRSTDYWASGVFVKCSLLEFLGGHFTELKPQSEPLDLKGISDQFPGGWLFWFCGDYSYVAAHSFSECIDQATSVKWGKHSLEMMSMDGDGFGRVFTMQVYLATDYNEEGLRYIWLATNMYGIKYSWSDSSAGYLVQNRDREIVELKMFAAPSS